MLQHEVGNSVCAGSDSRGKVGGRRKMFSRYERKAMRVMRLFSVGGLSELRQVASDILRKIFA